MEVFDARSIDDHDKHVRDPKCQEERVDLLRTRVSTRRPLLSIFNANKDRNLKNTVPFTCNLTLSTL